MQIGVGINTEKCTLLREKCTIETLYYHKISRKIRANSLKK